MQRCTLAQADALPLPSSPFLQIMHRFHFNSVLKRMSTIVETEGEGCHRWAAGGVQLGPCMSGVW